MATRADVLNKLGLVESTPMEVIEAQPKAEVANPAFLDLYLTWRESGTFPAYLDTSVASSLDGLFRLGRTS